MLGAHLGRKITQIKAEKKESLHPGEEVAQRRDQAIVTRQRGKLDVELEIAVEEVRLGLPVVFRVLGRGKGLQRSELF